MQKVDIFAHAYVRSCGVRVVSRVILSARAPFAMGCSPHKRPGLQPPQFPLAAIRGPDTLLLVRVLNCPLRPADRTSSRAFPLLHSNRYA